MTMKFSETVRRWMGWCPNAAMAGICRQRYAAPDGEVGIEAATGGSREVMEDVFVDYASPRFILLIPFAILGLLILFVVSLLIPTLWPGLIFTFLAISFIAWAALRLYFRSISNCDRVLGGFRHRPEIAYPASRLRKGYDQIGRGERSRSSRAPLGVRAALASHGCGDILQPRRGRVDAVSGRPGRRPRFRLSDSLGGRLDGADAGVSLSCLAQSAVSRLPQSNARARRVPPHLHGRPGEGCRAAWCPAMTKRTF